MMEELFLALGIRTINSQTFANGNYYEYSLENDEDGIYCITRRIRKRYGTSHDEPATAVETNEQMEACKQALMYNFPHAFNADGSVAIDLPKLPEPITSGKADAGHLDGAEADKERQSGTGRDGRWIGLEF